MILLGLTGSIGMGKSTTANLFARQGDPVVDADAIVHSLYTGRAVEPVEAIFPGVTRNGEVDRLRLGRAVFGDSEKMAALEAIIHPMVREEQQAAVDAARRDGRRIVVLDIPLLFETGREHALDAVLVVTAPAEVQRARVLQRPGMKEETFRHILARQMPDAEKRRRAHFIVDTGAGMEPARIRVAAIRRALLSIAGRRSTAFPD